VTNQCDGCRAKMPLVEGIHYFRGLIFSTCTAHRYEEEETEQEETEEEQEEERCDHAPAAWRSCERCSDAYGDMRYDEERGK
jgi:hypothetical protein